MALKNAHLYCLYIRTRRQEREMTILPELLSAKKGIFIDIGANMGAYTELVLRTCKHLHVHAFEPQPELCKNINKLGVVSKHFTIHNVGLAEKPAEMTLHVPIVNGSLSTQSATFQDISEPHKDIKIPVKTLDSFQFNDIAFIKIDVEGFESKTLAGAQETILKSKPIMLIEIENRHLQRFDNSQNGIHVATVEDVINQVESMGYRSSYYMDGKYYSTKGLDYAKCQAEALLNTPEYINNFFFFTSETQLPTIEKR
jgi:FkbM family methyltransferase